MYHSIPKNVQIIGSVCFIVLWCVGFAREYGSKCVNGIAFWIPGMIILTFLRFQRLIIDVGINNSMRPITGLVVSWTVVGNIVISTTSYSCSPKQTPIMLYTSIVYLLICDVFFVVAIVHRCRTGRLLPAPQSPQFFTISFDNNMELSTEQANYWKVWLQYYGCEEKPYDNNLISNYIANNNNHSHLKHDRNMKSTDKCGSYQYSRCSDECNHSMEIDLESGIMTEESIIRKSSQSIDTYHSDVSENDSVTCVICLSHLEDNVDAAKDASNLIVRYPCHGVHFFHSVCLKRWLKSSASRSMYLTGDTATHPISCPVCREAPTMPEHVMLARKVSSAFNQQFGGMQMGRLSGMYNGMQSTVINHALAADQAATRAVYGGPPITRRRPSVRYDPVPSVLMNTTSIDAATIVSISNNNNEDEDTTLVPNIATNTSSSSDVIDDEMIELIPPRTNCDSPPSREHNTIISDIVVV